MFSLFGCCSWNWTLRGSSSGRVSCCNGNSGRKLWADKRRVVRNWMYDLQHNSFSRQRYLNFLMAKKNSPTNPKTQKAASPTWSEMSGWLSSLMIWYAASHFCFTSWHPARSFVFCECSKLHQGFVNVRCVFTVYSRLNHSLIYCQWVLLTLS